MGNLSGLELAIMIVSGLIVVGLVVALIVQIVLIVKYKKFNKTPLQSGLTSQQTARTLLDANGLTNVQIKKLGFFRRILLFGNHYSVMRKTIYLRKNIIDSSSVTAVGIATQKVCLAIQHKNKDKSFIFRYVLQILTLFTPLLFYVSIAVGLIIDIVTKFSGLPTIVGLFVGLGFYLLTFILQIVNIKVEKKANEQAVEVLKSANIFNENEITTLQKLLKLYIISDIIILVLSILKLILQILKILARSKKSK